jgi:hypothetical protein
MARTKSGTPPNYRLYKRTGQAVVTLGGRDHYLGPHGTPASRQKYAGLIWAWERRQESTQISTVPLTEVKLLDQVAASCRVPAVASDS